MTLNLDRVMHEDTGNGYVTLNKETFVELVERCKEAEEQVARMSQSMIEPSGSPKGRMRHDDHATSAAGAKDVTMRAKSQKADLLRAYGRLLTVEVNAERYPHGRCWVCGDDDNHFDVPHNIATGDERSRYDVIREEGRDGYTDEEAAGVAHVSHVGYWKRCSELRNLGLIEDTGRTRPGVAGTPQMVCRITDRGLAVLRGLRVSQ
jgi:hypothetical protein